MLSTIIPLQGTTPVANIQQNVESQAVLHSQNAAKEVKEEERQIREDVVAKDDGVFYEHNPDAREKGNNTYSDMFRKKKKDHEEKEHADGDKEKRVNIDISI